MDVVLLTLTTLSLAAAAGFGLLSWRVGREEQERSRARVAALAAAMEPTHAIGTPADPEPRVAVGSVFDRGHEGLQGRPMIKMAVGGALALAVVLGVIVVAWTGGSTPPPRSAGPAPLELMSMRYLREGTTLTVSGLVRNPAAGAAVDRVTAVVFAFDRSGGFVASGRAPLEFSALGAGDESPFVVAVPNVSDVARYRVSFRTDRGVIRHVDRRGDQAQLAQAVR